MRDGQMREVDLDAPRPPSRAPMIIRDQFDRPFRSMLTGQMIDSRSANARHLRDYNAQTGREAIVVGDQTPVSAVEADTPYVETRDYSAAIAQTIDQMEAGR